MPWSTADIPDLTGRVAVVTGANGGLGFESAKALAGWGAHVVMAARDQARADTALREIERSHPDASVEIVPLDLGSQQSVRRAAEQILRAHPTVDILMNNAGVMALPERRTVDGYEMQLGVNHLGHWTLTALLIPAVLSADRSRVVSVTSTSHHFGRGIDPTNPHLEGRYNPWRAYGQSKLANYHFALGLQREFDRTGVRAESLLAHPGLSHTELQVRTYEQSEGRTGGFWRWMAQTTGMDAADGALPQLRAATDPRARGGEMYAPRFINFGAAVRRPIMRRVGLGRAIENLWVISEKETGVAMDLAHSAPR